MTRLVYERASAHSQSNRAVMYQAGARALFKDGAGLT
jgi:hypothetical protein